MPMMLAVRSLVFRLLAPVAVLMAPFVKAATFEALVFPWVIWDTGGACMEL